MSTVVGFLLAGASAACNGSFAAFQKSRKCSVKPHPIVFNAYVSLGVVASSAIATPFLPLAGYEIKFNILGMLAGSLFVLATLFSFLAIPRLGLAMAQGIWGGAALLTSFLWGVLGPKYVGLVPKSWAGSLCGVLLLVAGVVGMVYHASVAQRCCRCCDSETRNTGTGFLEIGENRDENHDEESVLIDAEGSGTPKTDASRSRSGNSFCLGLTFASLSACLEGV